MPGSSTTCCATTTARIARRSFADGGLGPASPSRGPARDVQLEAFCAFAREPETRKVAVDAQVSVSGVRYEVDPDLAGETGTLWFGLYDDQLLSSMVHVATVLCA